MYLMRLFGSFVMNDIFFLANSKFTALHCNLYVFKDKMTSLDAKLMELEKLESDLVDAMFTASKCLQELAKDKVAPKQVENQTQDFLKKIKSVETGISAQINYLNQVGIGAPHEGSAYGAIRDRQASMDRVNYLRGALSSTSSSSSQNPVAAAQSTFLPPILKNEQQQHESMQF